MPKRKAGIARLQKRVRIVRVFPRPSLPSPSALPFTPSTTIRANLGPQALLAPLVAASASPLTDLPGHPNQTLDKPAEVVNGGSSVRTAGVVATARSTPVLTGGCRPPTRGQKEDDEGPSPGDDSAGRMGKPQGKPAPSKSQRIKSTGNSKSAAPVAASTKTATTGKPKRAGGRKEPKTSSSRLTLKVENFATARWAKRNSLHQSGELFRSAGKGQGIRAADPTIGVEVLGLRELSTLAGVVAAGIPGVGLPTANALGQQFRFSQTVELVDEQLAAAASKELDESDGEEENPNERKVCFTGLDTSLAPMSNLKDIYRDLVVRSLRGGLDDVVERLGGNVIKVATLCSGTESPLLAMQMLAEGACHFMQFMEHLLTFSALRENDPEHPLRYQHLFSCEIEPSKQAYIQRNFFPPCLFRDVNDLVNDTA